VVGLVGEDFGGLAERALVLVGEPHDFLEPREVLQDQRGSGGSFGAVVVAVDPLGMPGAEPGGGVVVRHAASFRWGDSSTVWWRSRHSNASDAAASGAAASGHGGAVRRCWLERTVSGAGAGHGGVHAVLQAEGGDEAYDGLVHRG